MYKDLSAKLFAKNNYQIKKNLSEGAILFIEN